MKKRRDSRTSKDVLDEAQARHKLKILAMSTNANDCSVL